MGLTEEDKQKVPKIVDALKKHVAGSVNETVERKSFRMRKQHMHESFDDYVTTLRDLVKICNYCNDECINKALRDQIIEGLQDGDTVEELLRQKQLTIETTLRIGRAHESARQQREEIKSNPMNSAINATHTNKTKQSHANSWRGSRDKSRREIHDRKPRTCGRCGKAQHRILEACPAIDKGSDISPHNVEHQYTDYVNYSK